MRNFIFREEKGKRKMRFFSRACCSLLFGLSSSLLYAQSSDIPSVSLNVKNATLSYVLEDIHKQSGYDFVLSGSDVKQVKGITFSIKRVPLETALKELLKDSDLAYRIENKTIIIYRKPASQKEQTAEKSERKISGLVKDMNGDLLPGVSVSLKGKKVSAVTDLDGEWTMTLTDEKNPILVFSFVGMKTLELPYKGEPFLNITLEENVTKMDEVVVTGMFNKPRESYTGSVTTITSKELKMFRGQNMIQTLGNIDPSFNIVQNNSLGSNPNNLPEVNIRGNSSLPSSLNDLEQGVKAQLNAPLVIMDGFEISLQKLMDFNDEEIESINLLKDASATAIYGSRGSNGVIVVTTKKPEAGKLKLLVRTGLQLEVPDLTSYDLLNAWEKLDLEQQRQVFEFYYQSGLKYIKEHPEDFGEIISRPVDRRENYVKRCVGLPGQTLEIKDRIVYLDGQPNKEPDNVEYRYEVRFKHIRPELWSELFMPNSMMSAYTLCPGKTMKDIESYLGLPEDLIEECGLSADDLAGSISENGTLCVPLTAHAKSLLEARTDIVESVSYIPGGDAGGLYPLNKRTGWTIDNYGPVWIPKKGETIELNLDNLPLYERPITHYENNTLTVKNGKIYINGEETTRYTFKMDYYWMMGDNRHNSADSRFWGFVPEDHIVGKPIFIWLSLDQDRGWFDGKIRWERLFRNVSSIK